jgi:hypothetical protein
MAVRLTALGASRTLLPRNIFFSSGTHLCSRLRKPQGPVLLECLGELKKLIDIIGSRPRDLQACSIVPQPTTLHVSLWYIILDNVFFLL